MCFLDCHSTFLLVFCLAAGTVLYDEFSGNNIDKHTDAGDAARFLQPLTEKIKETNAPSNGNFI